MPADVLSDNFVNLCISSEANWFGEGCRILVEGQMTDDGSSVANKIVPVTGQMDIETRFGVGSILSESLKTVFCACPGLWASVYALARVDDAAAVKAVYTLTVTGPATTDGRVTIFWGNDTYKIDIGVDAGDTATVIAQAIADAIPDAFPYEATVAGGVITLTARNAGTISNNLQAIYNWQDRINFAPDGVELALDQTVVGVGSFASVEGDYANIVGQCCYDCYILSSDDTDKQEALRDHIRDAWSCDKPQCFGHGYVYNRGTLGQVLADGDNSAELSRMAVCASDPVFPYLKNANYGALSCCVACVNPEVSIQGQTHGLLSCVRQPQSCDACWEWDEIVQLKANHFVVTGPANIGSGGLTNPYVFNDVTNYLYDELGRPNATWRDTSSRRLAKATAIEIATELQSFNGLGLFTKNTAIKEKTIGTNPKLMLGRIRAWAKSKIGVLFSEFKNINEDIQVRTDFETQPECVGRPGILHWLFRYRPPVRIVRNNVSLVPELLDNCNR